MKDFDFLNIFEVLEKSNIKIKSLKLEKYCIQFNPVYYRGIIKNCNNT